MVFDGATLVVLVTVTLMMFEAPRAASAVSMLVGPSPPRLGAPSNGVNWTARALCARNGIFVDNVRDAGAMFVFGAATTGAPTETLNDRHALVAVTPVADVPLCPPVISHTLRAPANALQVITEAQTAEGAAPGQAWDDVPDAPCEPAFFVSAAAGGGGAISDAHGGLVCRMCVSVSALPFVDISGGIFPFGEAVSSPGVHAHAGCFWLADLALASAAHFVTREAQEGRHRRSLAADSFMSCVRLVLCAWVLCVGGRCAAALRTGGGAAPVTGGKVRAPRRCPGCPETESGFHLFPWCGECEGRVPVCAFCVGPSERPCGPRVLVGLPRQLRGPVGISTGYSGTRAMWLSACGSWPPGLRVPCGGPFGYWRCSRAQRRGAHIVSISWKGAPEEQTARS